MKSIPPGARAYGAAFFQGTAVEPAGEPLFVQYVRESSVQQFIGDVLSAAKGTSVTATLQAGQTVLVPPDAATELITSQTPQGYLAVDARSLVTARSDMGYLVGETMRFTAIQRPGAGTLVIFQRGTTTTTDDDATLARSKITKTVSFTAG